MKPATSAGPGTLDAAPGGNLRLPVLGLEAEFRTWVDGEVVDPAAYWVEPAGFIDRPLLSRGPFSAQLPTGGAVYFDEGVLEVVTPVIELDAGCTARVVRSLWEQISLVRGELTRWSEASAHEVRLEGFSAHYNISFEDQGGGRTAEALALLLAHVLPLPVALIAGNRRTTGVGVRPRGDRIEITTDFTPDPGLMVAAATLILGVVRGAMTWPSYDLAALAEQGIPVVDGVTPGKHSSRKGWLARDVHYPRSPFTTSVDARVFPLRDGRHVSLRAITREIAWTFRRSIRRHADPFSFRLLFAVLEGQAPSMLELPDRPGAYEDVGRACRWGEVLPELRGRPENGRWTVPEDATWSTGSFEAHIAERQHERQRHRRRQAREQARAARGGKPPVSLPATGASETQSAPGAATTVAPTAPPEGYRGKGRRETTPGRWAEKIGEVVDRRRRPGVLERRIHDDQAPASTSQAFPAGSLTRSSYEQVFLRLVSGAPVDIDGHAHTPVGMRGWYQAVFRRNHDGAERIVSIDDLRDRGAEEAAGSRPGS